MSVELEVVQANLAGRACGDRRGSGALGPQRRARSSCWPPSSTSRPRTWRRSPTPASSSPARTASSSCWPSRRSPASASPGTSSATSRAARRATSSGASGSCTRSPRSRPPSASIAAPASRCRASSRSTSRARTSKQGLAPGELDAFLEAVAALPGIRIQGLMTMPPLRRCRRGLAALLRGPQGARRRARASAGRRSTSSAVSRWARARTTPSPWRRERPSFASDRPSTVDRAYSLATHGSRRRLVQNEGVLRPGRGR